MRYPENISRKGSNFSILLFLSRRDTLVQIDDIAYFSCLGRLFILREIGPSSVIYRPYPHIPLKWIFHGIFLSNIWMVTVVPRNMIMVCLLSWTWTKQFWTLD